MNGAVEICKLRLFLKLASELKSGEDIEALPDIDFNIRPGNSLIGYTSLADMKNAIKAEEGELELDNRTAEIKATAQKLSKEFRLFRDKQMERDGKLEAEDKKNLRDKLQESVDKLDHFLAQDYKIKPNDNDFQVWRKSVQPFHWWAEFHDIIDKGGFHAIIGNPPYLAASRVDYSPKGFQSSGTIHGYFVEQSAKLLSQDGGMSMILPSALLSGKGMKEVQNIIEKNRNVWYSSYSNAPARLFEGADLRLAIFINTPASQKKIFTTGFKKWNSSVRINLIPTLYYVESLKLEGACWIPKFQNTLESSIFDKVINQKLLIKDIWGDGNSAIYYRRTGGRSFWIFTNSSPKFSTSTQEKKSIKQKYNSIIVVALLSSNIFWWWYTMVANMRDLMKTDIEEFRTNSDIFDDDELITLGREYLADVQKNSRSSTIHVRTGITQTQFFRILKSKPIINKIDAALSHHYGFTVEELDFIQNYDVKFRYGSDSNMD